MPRTKSRRAGRVIRWTVVATLVVALVAGLGWFFGGMFNTPEPLERRAPLAAPSASPSATATPPSGSQSDSQSGATTPGPSTAGLPSLVPGSAGPGLGGSGQQLDVPPLDLVVRVTSTAPIGTVGWVIPTSRDDATGTDKGVGTSWSLRTQVYGNPDYARVFLQAGPSGDTITCVITVEGKVTEQRSTVGPYGQIMCQG